MERDNAPGADNQQERLDPCIAGYVDGEGSFHVAVQRNPSCRLGWQLVPEFHVSQLPERRQVLDLIQARLGCGRIRENHRGTADTTLVLVVRRRDDLLRKVLPFFEAQPLLSSKQKDFLTFAATVRSMAKGDHLSATGFAVLRQRALTMNGGGRYRRVHKRSVVSIQNPQRPYAEHREEPVKIWSDLHGDMQSQAELETTWPGGRQTAGNTSVGPYPMQP